MQLAPSSELQKRFLNVDATIIVYGGSLGCLPANAEFLSATGWKKMSEWQQGDKVAQYEPESDKLTFVTPSHYIKLPCESFERMEARGLDFILSDEHRVLYYNAENINTPKVISYQEVKRRHRASLTKGWTGKIKTTFKHTGEGLYNLDGSLLSDDQLRLQVAVQADGSVKHLGKDGMYLVYIRVYKPRKDARLRRIVDSLGLDYKRTEIPTVDKIQPIQYEYVLKLDRADKFFTPDYYQCTQHQLEVIGNEIEYWDGSSSKNESTKTLSYSNNHKSNVDFVQFCWHACGRNTVIGRDKRDDKYTDEHWYVFGNGTGAGFRAFSNKDGKCDITEYKSEDGFKYCFSVPTSFFLVRQNNKVFITGNSGKAQPLDAKVLTPDGFKPMGEIVVGSEVITPDNKVANVTNVYPFDSKPIYKITTESGKVVHACDEHLWSMLVKDKSDNSTLAKDFLLTTADMLGGWDAYSFHVPIFNSEPEKISSIEYINDAPAQCISIDSEDHLYVTDDYIVTHNTYNGILRHLRFCTDPHYVGYVIRKYEKVLRDGGGCFNEAVEMCRMFCPNIRVTTKPMRIMFPWGACLYFGGYEDDKAGDKYRGLQLSTAMVDEGNQLKEDHIWMLISRLRSKAKVDGHIWITCNPDPDSYLAKWVDWYLYPKGHELAGRPDPAKNGKIRYFVRFAGAVVWANSEQELRDIIRIEYRSSAPIRPLTFVFLGGTIEDNPILIRNNPSYKDRLDGLPRVQKERDYYGRQNCRAA